MGIFCDVCEKKFDVNGISRVEIKVISNNYPNSNYIIKRYDMCDDCYLELYNKLSLIVDII